MTLEKHFQVAMLKNFVECDFQLVQSEETSRFLFCTLPTKDPELPYSVPNIAVEAVIMFHFLRMCFACFDSGLSG